MGRYRNDYRVGLVALATAIAPCSAWAQSTPASGSAEEAPNTIGDIVVTAQKRQERLINVPASITAETGETLQRRGAAQLEDIIRNTPGITNSGAGQGNSTNITIRGVSTGTSQILKQSTVSLLLDDIPVDPQTASTLTTNLRTVDIERVEVLRGPQGTLFGSGSLSGAVRFITNKPDFSGLGGSAELTAATTKRGEESYSGHIVLNAPLVDEKLAVRAVGYGYQDGGWIDNITTGEDDVNRVETYGGRLSLAYRPSDRLSFNLTGIYQNNKDKGGGESLYAPLAGVSDYRHVTTLARSPTADLENTLVNLAAEYDFDEVILFSSSTYHRRETNTNMDVGYFNTVLGSLFFGVPGLTGAAPNIIDSGYDIYTQELRLSSSGSGPLRWTVGGFYLKADGGGVQSISSPVIVPFIGTDVLASLATSGGQEELSGFGELTYTFADRIDVTGGIRVSRTTVDFSTASAGLILTGNPNPAAIVRTDISQKETVANPRFSISYRPNMNATIYAQAARGFRVGGPNLSAGLGGGDIPTSYGSDSLWNYEVGAKARLAGGRVRLGGAAFYIDWSNIQTALSLNNVAYTGNAGAARIMGLELEAAVNPTDNFEFGGSFSVSDNELTQDTPTLTRVTGVVGVLDGERLPASPERQATGYAELTVPVGGYEAYLRATAQYVGGQFTDFGEQGTRFGDFATLDLRAGLNLGGLEVVVFANNLFDSQGKRSAADPRVLFGTFVAEPQLAYRVRPRTVGLTLRSRFGTEAR